jgi:hypothetical protein
MPSEGMAMFMAASPVSDAVGVAGADKRDF